MIYKVIEIVLVSKTRNIVTISLFAPLRQQPRTIPVSRFSHLNAFCMFQYSAPNAYSHLMSECDSLNCAQSNVCYDLITFIWFELLCNRYTFLIAWLKSVCNCFRKMTIFCWHDNSTAFQFDAKMLFESHSSPYRGTVLQIDSIGFWFRFCGKQMRAKMHKIAPVSI